MKTTFWGPARLVLSGALVASLHAASAVGWVGGWLVIDATHAQAKEEETPGIPLEIQVVDAQGAPIPTAKVRNPQEKDPKGVNADTGTWKGSVLYLPDGTEMFFAKGMELTFEISAPGYKNQKITYVMRKRKNRVLITLEKMALDMNDVEEEDPVIQFGRDKPIGGR
jgi:hypothetical protein